MPVGSRYSEWGGAVRNKARPRIHRREKGAIFLETPYDPFFLEQIKTLIPAKGRRFMTPPEGPAKGWWITAEWVDVAEHLMNNAFPGAIDEIDIEGCLITRDEDGRRLVQDSLFTNDGGSDDISTC